MIEIIPSFIGASSVLASFGLLVHTPFNDQAWIKTYETLVSVENMLKVESKKCFTQDSYIY